MADTPSTIRVQLSLRPEEHKALTDEARRCGLSLATLARQALRRAMGLPTIDTRGIK